LSNCPLGLVYRTEYIRTLKSIWEKASTKDYIIESIKRSSKNIKPIIVIDDTDLTKEAQCYLVNRDLTNFEEYHNKILCRRVEAIAEYCLTKYKIQKSNKSKENKEKYCLLNEVRNLRHQELEAKDEKAFNKFVKEL
tara:strand:+ start:103 stop:513 length:411 start_codon:yes stop_codon:yes gene_type:complete